MVEGVFVGQACPSQIIYRTQCRTTQDSTTEGIAANFGPDCALPTLDHRVAQRA